MAHITFSMRELIFLIKSIVTSTIYIYERVSAFCYRVLLFSLHNYINEHFTILATKAILGTIKGKTVEYFEVDNQSQNLYYI